MGTWIHYNSNGSGNQMIGNIMYLPIAPAIGAFSDQADCGKTSSGTVIKNNVALALAGGSGFTEECANYNNGTVLSNNTFVGNNGINSRGVLLSYRRTCPLQKAAIATAYNNSFLNLRNGFMIGNSGVNNHLLERGYNNLYNVTLSVYDPDGYIAGPKPSPETTMNPHYDTAVAKYGFGAYLMVPAALQGQGKVIDSVATDIGANVLFQYTGGEFGTALSLDTTKQLWPWPMEERIYEEYGVSPTYMYRNGDSLSTGGLWLGTPASSSFSNLYKHLRKPRL